MTIPVPRLHSLRSSAQQLHQLIAANSIFVARHRATGSYQLQSVHSAPTCTKPLRTTSLSTYFHNRKLEAATSQVTGIPTTSISSRPPQKLHLHLHLHLHHNMTQEILAPGDQAVANPGSTSASNTDTQPPQACLLGLPKELLNYIITLAVVEDPEADPTTLLLEQRQRNDGHAQSGRVEAFSSPALARTCTTLEATVLPIYYGQHTFHFCSMNVASQWLNQERRMKIVASVRRVKVHCGLTPKLRKQLKRKRKALDMFLEADSRVLALSKASSFFADLCEDCRWAFRAKVQWNNDRDSEFRSGEEKLAALACYFDRRIGIRTYGCNWRDSFG